MTKNFNYYALQISNLTLNTTESLLQISSLMLDAKKLLPNPDYLKVLALLEYSGDNSTVRKWNKIGENYLKLKPVVHLLPPKWTVLYQLAKMPTEEFLFLQETNILKPSMSSEDIALALCKQKKKLPKIQLVIEFNQTVNDEDFLELHRLIEEHVSANICTLKLSDAAEELLESQTTQS